MGIFNYQIEEDIRNKEYPVTKPGIYYGKLKKIYHDINETYNKNLICIEFNVGLTKDNLCNIFSFKFDFANKNTQEVKFNLKLLSHVLLVLKDDPKNLQLIIDEVNSLNEFVNKIRLFVGLEGSKTIVAIKLQDLVYNDKKYIGVNKVEFPFIVTEKDYNLL